MYVKSSSRLNSFRPFPTIRSGISKILAKTRTPLEISFFFFLIRYTFLIIFLIDFDQFEAADSFSPIVTALKSILPYNREFTFNIIITLMLLAIPFGLLTGIVLLVVLVGLNKVAGHGLNFIGIFIYAYQFTFGYWVLGQQIYFFFAPVDFDLTYKPILGILMGILIVLEILFILFLNITFVNFFLNSKDSLARDPDISFFIVEVVTLTSTVLDPCDFQLLSHVQSVLVFVNCIFQLFNYYFKYPYHSYVTRKLNFLFTKIVCFMAFIFTFVVIWEVEIIRQNYFACGAVIMVMLVIIEVIYKDDQTAFMSLEETIKTGSPALKAQAGAIYALIKSSKSSKNDELSLLSILYQHMKSCANTNCLCQNREACYDPKTQKESNTDLPLWKDPVFLKNFVWSILVQTVKSGKHQIPVELYFILFSLEKLEKTVLTGIQLKAFGQRVRSVNNLGYWFGVKTIRQKLKKIVKSRAAESPSARSDFENLAVYDSRLNELK